MITAENTHWVLICGINSEKENSARHVNDLAFGLSVIRGKGVPKESIDILVDPCINNIISELPNRDHFQDIQLDRVINYKHTLISKPNLNNLIIIIFGHGFAGGIDADDSLKPHNLISAIHQKQHLNCCIVVFGQCYSGIYNFLNLSAPECSSKLPNICLLGASNLNSSLSSAVQINLANDTLHSWSANIFLFTFFMWIGNHNLEAFNLHRDIDGDGKETLMDAYKFAGVVTSQILLNCKTDIAIAIHAKQQELVKKQKDLEKADGEEKLTLQLDINGLIIYIRKATDISHTIQDSWFLNAHKAREIEFLL